jgi:hypothetical protein
VRSGLVVRSSWRIGAVQGRSGDAAYRSSLISTIPSDAGERTSLGAAALPIRIPLERMSAPK